MMEHEMLIKHPKDAYAYNVYVIERGEMMSMICKVNLELQAPSLQH